MPRTRLELARPKADTRPSTLRVYQFHHLGDNIFIVRNAKLAKKLGIKNYFLLFYGTLQQRNIL